MTSSNGYTWSKFDPTMNIASQIRTNNFKTWVIMCLFVVFITTLIYVYTKAFGVNVSYVYLAFFFSLFSAAWSYFASDKLVLTFSRAKKIQRSYSPILFQILEDLTQKDNIPMPKVYLIEDSAPNAFATGRDPKHAVVCVTSGIIEKLNKVELEGVLAHELSHVKNLDIRLMSIVVVLVGVVTLLAELFMRSLWFGGSNRQNRDRDVPAVFMIVGIILAILSPLVATLIQLAISRKRELLADSSGALLTRYPEGLASALEKIAKDREPLEAANNATAHLYIVNPFKGKNIQNMFAGLFNTHPPIEERIRILRSM